ncbi:MAG: hypothetical protein AcusKO_04760 [Acuticoccus sp.]
MTRRTLRPGERALWQKVARSVTPLKPQPPEAAAKPPHPSPPPAPPAPPAREKKRGAKAARPPADGGAPAGKSGATPRGDSAAAMAGKPRGVPGDLDRNLRRRLARGAERIDGRIDLHGLTQEEAHGVLIRFIDTSFRGGRRTVLVITGKGRGGDGRGILRRAVPHWLNDRAIKSMVVSFGPAHQNHGGDGALYVRLRGARRGR